ARLLNPKESLASDDNAVAAAAPADDGLCPRFRSTAAALLAVFFARDGDGFGDAAGRFEEVDLDADLKIPASARPEPDAAAADENVADDAAEQVEDRCSVVERRSAVVLQPRMAVAVVALPFVHITQHVIRFGRFLELLLRLLVSNVAVRMILHRQLAERPLNLLAARFPCDAEDFVVVPLTGHHFLTSGQR